MTSYYIGYHGTSLTSAKRLLEQGFTASSKENEWLGQGVYFFGSDGSVDGQDEAKCWAKYVRKLYPWAVIKAEIYAEKPLDLVHNIKHRKLFNTLRDKCYQLHVKSGRDKNSFSDYIIFNFADKNYFFDAIIAYTEGSKNKYPYDSYIIRRLQVQICVKNNDTIHHTCIVDKGEK